MVPAHGVGDNTRLPPYRSTGPVVFVSARVCVEWNHVDVRLPKLQGSFDRKQMCCGGVYEFLLETEPKTSRQRICTLHMKSTSNDGLQPNSLNSFLFCRETSPNETTAPPALTTLSEPVAVQPDAQPAGACAWAEEGWCGACQAASFSMPGWSLKVFLHVSTIHPHGFSGRSHVLIQSPAHWQKIWT